MIHPFSKICYECLQYRLLTCKFRECIRMGAVGARTRRYLGQHLLHPLISRLLVLCAPADFEAQSSLLTDCTRRSKILTHALYQHKIKIYGGFLQM